MRRVTRNAVLLLLAVLVALLALGALPGLLKSGDPYYLTADSVDASATNVTNNASATTNVTGNASATSATGNASAVNGTALSARQFPYTTEALRNGTSEPYWRGPWGLKESFTHSPFDEVSALRARNPGATTGDGIFVRHNATLYRVGVGQQP